MECRDVPEQLLRMRICEEHECGKEGGLARSSETNGQLEDQSGADELGCKGDQVVADRILTESADLEPEDEICYRPVPVVGDGGEECQYVAW